MLYQPLKAQKGFYRRRKYICVSQIVQNNNMNVLAETVKKRNALSRTSAALFAD
jgi:hypothetical protein